MVERRKSYMRGRVVAIAERMFLSYSLAYCVGMAINITRAINKLNIMHIYINFWGLIICGIVSFGVCFVFKKLNNNGTNSSRYIRNIVALLSLTMILACIFFSVGYYLIVPIILKIPITSTMSVGMIIRLARISLGTITWCPSILLLLLNIFIMYKHTK